MRAGLTIIRENEKDPTRKHVEFVAVHKTTGQHILVEAKSRHRAGVLGREGARDEIPAIKFQRLINDAVAKDPTNPLAIFVDTNLPEHYARLFYVGDPGVGIPISKAKLAVAQRTRKSYGGIDPYNLLVFSNHPRHYSSDDQAAPPNRLAGIILQCPRIPVFHQKAVLDLYNAVNLYGNVPTHFPENPNTG